MNIHFVKVSRDEEIETLKEIIDNDEEYRENSEEGLTILLNGSWGSGKTSFINDFVDSIKNDKTRKYELFCKYDAFEYDFYENPYIPLLSTLNEAKNLKLDIDLKKVFKVTGKQALKDIGIISYKLTKSILKSKVGIDLEDITPFKDAITEYEKENEELLKFKNLNDAKKSIKKKITDRCKDKPYILIIDELDRCSPTFAIGTLEIIKYFLDIKNLIIILSLDKIQLQESVKTIYGQNMNCDVYFSKFFDYQFDLNKISFDKIVNREGISDFDYIVDKAHNIFETFEISTRDSHKIFLEFVSKYRKYNNSWTKEQSIFILFMLTLKNTNLTFYNNIIKGNSSVYIKEMSTNQQSEFNKYNKILNLSIEETSPIQRYLNEIDRYKNHNYMDIKYFNVIHNFSNDEFTTEQNIMKNMSIIIPYIDSKLTYMETLKKILN